MLPKLDNIGLKSAPASEDWSGVSEFIIQYDPGTEVSSIHIIEGEADYYNLIMKGEESEVLTAGQSLTIKSNGLEYVEPLTQEQWQDMIDENGLTNIPFPSKTGIDELFNEDDSGNVDALTGETSGSTVNPVIFVAIAVVVIALLFFGIHRMRTNASKN